MKALPRAAAWSIPTLVYLLGLTGCSSPRMSHEHDADAAPVTAADSCGARSERCNARDDDCDGIIDEDADSSCAIAHAAATCVRGACVIERCSNGYYNCNGVNSDGCEARRPCGECQADPASCEPPDAAAAQPMDASVMPSMSQQTGTGEGPSAPSSSMPDAAVSAPPQAPEGAAGAGAGGQSGAAGEAGQHPQVARPGHAGESGAAGSEPDADGGTTLADAGTHCEPERCDGKDNDCDQKVDEEGACRCADSAPTGQGEACDRCTCESCGEALDNCTGTSDDEWNMLCGNVLRCFGKSVQAGLCTGSDTDCYQNGNGPCAAEFRASFARGFMCTSDPVRTPCGGLTRVRLECYKTKCSAVCKP